MSPREIDRLILETQIRIGRDKEIVQRNAVGKITSILTNGQRLEIAEYFERRGQIQAAQYFRKGINEISA